MGGYRGEGPPVEEGQFVHANSTLPALVRETMSVRGFREAVLQGTLILEKFLREMKKRKKIFSILGS